MIAGFEPLTVGYQTQLGSLAAESPAKATLKTTGGRLLARTTSCLCAVLERVPAFL